MAGPDQSFESHGTTLRFFEALPTGEPRGAVIVVPDVWGLSDHYRDIADRLAAEGYAAFSIDIYSRGEPPDPAAMGDLEKVAAWIEAIPDRRVMQDIQMLVGHIGTMQALGRPRVGVTGFCLGGQYALMAGAAVSGLDVSASWYGMLRTGPPSQTTPESALDMAVRLACPWLGLYGQEDALIPKADVEELRSILESEGADFELITYPGAGHAFFNDTRPDAYRAEAASDGWQRMLDLFGRHLVG